MSPEVFTLRVARQLGQNGHGMVTKPLLIQWWSYRYGSSMGGQTERIVCRGVNSRFARNISVAESWWPAVLLNVRWTDEEPVAQFGLNISKKVLFKGQLNFIRLVLRCPSRRVTMILAGVTFVFGGG
jgi:hypothetical protein